MLADPAGTVEVLEAIVSARTRYVSDTTPVAVRSRDWSSSRTARSWRGQQRVPGAEHEGMHEELQFVDEVGVEQLLYERTAPEDWHTLPSVDDLSSCTAGTRSPSRRRAFGHWSASSRWVTMRSACG